MDALSPQILGKVYSVLSDKEQRALYNEQGTVDEDSDVLNQDRDWETYWRLLFKKVEDSGDFSVTVHSFDKRLLNAFKALHFVLCRNEEFVSSQNTDIYTHTSKHSSGDTKNKSI